MALESGAKLGPFEIISPLGAGGMGEVYRARDTRLDRAVAIKVLSERLSQNSGLRQRLEVEARAISRLSHPNICTLHDIGHQDGMDFLVLEFVEGNTLRQLLDEGILPVRKIIPIALQVADGLAKAHEAGVIHRDLKPENLMVSADLVKILDFGLAKLAAAEQENDTCTTSVNNTDPGTLIGTVAYMSPEQIRGAPLDFRSDQFSFGLVLYEMTTGRRAFQGKTHTQTLLAIVGDEPQPVGSFNPEVPPPLCWVIERCLAKEPAKRYASTRDLARDLAAIRDRLSDLQVRRVETRPSNLPVPASALVGRDTELAAASALLLRPEVRLVTVTGPGGIGKSRLALEVARSAAEQFPLGVFFVPLAGVSDPGLVPSVIAQTLGLRETGGQPPLETLREHLRNSGGAPLLLLIDNFEHLMTAAPALSGLLALSSGLKLLVTSRAPLHVSHEHEFPVPPLALPTAKSLPALEALAQIPAVSLFLQRASAVKPDFHLTEENAPSLAEICARLDGLPLAIELAAARIKLLSPSAMQTRLASRLQLLTGGARDLPARQQTLRHAMDWSYDLLNTGEQKLFRRLAVFVGGCTLEAVESVCDAKLDLGLDVLDGMSSMVDKSLVRQIEQPDGEPRFLMLETIREYALCKLAESGEEFLARRALAAYCLVLAEEGAADEDSLHQKRWMSRFELEHDNFRSALEWLTESNQAEWGLRLATALFRFWEAREYLAEGRDRLGRLLRLPGAAAHNTLRSRALFSAAVLASEQGDYEIADELVAESLAIARQLGDRHGIAVSLNCRAVNAREQGQLAASRALFEETVGLWRELQDAPAVARALSNLAGVVKLQGDHAHARVLYEQCLAIFRSIDDSTGIAWALNHQGDAARDQGDIIAARSLYEQSLATFRKLDDRWGIARSLADLGHLARAQHNFPIADAFYRESIAVFRELEHKRGVARLLEAFACSAAAQSQCERSLRLAGAAAALRQSIGAPLAPAEQRELESSLESARRSLPSSAGGTAWLEGWDLSMQQAVEVALAPMLVSRGPADAPPQRAPLGNENRDS